MENIVTFIVFIIVSVIVAAIINKNIEGQTKKIIAKHNSKLIKKYTSLTIKVRTSKYTRWGKGDVYLYDKFLLLDDRGFKFGRGKLSAIGFKERTPILSLVQFRLEETELKDDKLILKGEIEGVLLNDNIRYTITNQDVSVLKDLGNKVDELYLSKIRN